MTTPTTAPIGDTDIPAPPSTEPTHPCVRCGAPVAIDVGLCEKCNPLGLRDTSASQVHGIAILGVALAVVGLAVFGRLAFAGVGPFPASAVAAPDGAGLAVAVTVTNQGSSAGQTSCRISDPADRTGAIGAFVLTPRVEPNQTLTFTAHVTEFGSTARPLVADCKAP